jgi:hypothetical protein
MQGSGGGAIDSTDSIGGFGGSSLLGGGAKSPGNANTSFSGYAYGGGGSGNGNSTAGGAGAAGVVVVEY